MLSGLNQQVWKYKFSGQCPTHMLGLLSSAIPPAVFQVPKPEKKTARCLIARPLDRNQLTLMLVRLRQRRANIHRPTAVSRQRYIFDSHPAATNLNKSLTLFGEGSL